eukprot:1155976-Pelagomonas_calceolata.AAC.3
MHALKASTGSTHVFKARALCAGSIGWGKGCFLHQVALAAFPGSVFALCETAAGLHHVLRYMHPVKHDTHHEQHETCQHIMRSMPALSHATTLSTGCGYKASCQSNWKLAYSNKMQQEVAWHVACCFKAACGILTS